MKTTSTKTALLLLSILCLSFSAYAQPTVYDMTGGGTTCSNDSGVHVGLSGSDASMTYQLYNGSSTVGGTVTGTGDAIDFGLQTTSGTYTVVADPGAGDATTMSGTSTVTINAAPTAYSISGSGSYCAGSPGVDISLGGSDAGVSYQLYTGTTAAGSAVSGTGSSIDFGDQTDTATYFIIATNTTTSCFDTMTGSATITVNALPNTYSITGGGNACASASGVDVGLGGSDAGISYQLYNGGSTTGSAVSGSSSSIDFGNQTTSGTYFVIATNTSTSCSDTMTGNATVTINPTPAAYSISGNGSYCSGSSGVDVSLGGSDGGVNYQLYNGASTVGSAVSGTGSSIDFGNQTDTGIYYIIATNSTSSCTDTMTGTAHITVNAVPDTHSVTGGGVNCSSGTGVDVGLDGSESGVNYQLYNGGTATGSAVSGAGSSIDFGNQTTSGTYFVIATNTSTSCSDTMTGGATVTINPTPTTYSITGGGSYCSGGAGVDVGLGGSGGGVNYQLYNGTSTVGSAVSGTGSSIDFGNQTASGTYTVVATNATTSCTDTMTSSALVSVNSLPTASYSISSGGNYCSGGTGVDITLSGSDAGINYQLYDGAVTEGSAISGTGSSLDFSNQTDSGTYFVVATDATTFCSDTMTSTAAIIINALPTVYSLTGGGSYCAGGSGVDISLSSSDNGINYQLLDGATTEGSSVSGSGSSIDFGNQTDGGTYTVVATDATTSCTNNMSGAPVVTILAIPSVYSVTGGGNYCSGATGVDVALGGSDGGVDYQLYNGSSTVGSLVSGTGSSIDFGNQTDSGTYTVVANPGSTCSTNMSDSAVVIINPLPVVYSVTGGGNYCSGGTGVDVALSGTDAGINYQLYNGTATADTLFSGTGSSIDFGNQTDSGTYTVVATNATTTCTSNMSSSATVVINPLPTAYSVAGGGNYCSGGTGLDVSLGGSDGGINYQLYNGASTVGSAVSGTGSSLDFGNQTDSGTYTIVATNATTSCINNMSSSATVVINPLPSVYSVTGGGNYCSGGTGVDVALDGSDTGINYQLYDGSSTTGSAISGSGSSLDFGNQTAAGTYTVVATNSSTTCMNNMSASATVVINPLPNVYSLSGTGSYCAGGSGIDVTLNGSDTGINYQLYIGTTAMGSAVPGTGSSTLDLGYQTSGGTYTAVATNTTTSCINNMTGSAVVTVLAVPSVYSISSGGNYCSGGTGIDISISGSDGSVNYQLYDDGSPVGSLIPGTGSGIDFGSQTGAGTYTVTANPGYSCATNMSGSAVVVINPLPTPYPVSGGGQYCAGGTGYHVYLNASDAGINYQLYNGTSMVGAALSGTTAALDFGLQSAAGTYKVIATNTSTSCINNMSNTEVIIVNPLPNIYSLTGGGSYCSGGTGKDISLSSSDTGISYQLYNGGSASGSPLAGTNSSLDFGLNTAGGTYTVIATNATTGCYNNMTGAASIAVSASPNVYTVIGGGAYCAGGTGADISLNGSQTGVHYQLYIGGITTVGSAVSGTGVSLDMGVKTTVGSYTVVATNTSTSCTSNMLGSASITTNPLPVAYSVSGGGAYCAGGTGADVGLAGSDIGVNYTLYDGPTIVDAASGTGSSLDFGLKTASGTYTIIGANTTTGCTNNMEGNAIISVNPLPTAYSISAGGAYCYGGTGVDINLGTSASGISYQLLLGGAPVGSALPGSTGSMVDFGLQTVAGSYTVFATNTSTSCTNNMNGSASISVNPLPVSYIVTGGGGYCAGGTGVDVALSASDFGVNYQLYLNSSALGTALSGTGATLDFGMQAGPGIYTVTAINTATTCSDNMYGSATVVENVLPSTYMVSGGGTYCTGGTGVDVALGGSDAGVNYQLYNGSTAAGSLMAGTGSALDFGLQAVTGSYSVFATNATTGCTNNMSGAAVISMRPLPAIYTVTGGGSFCSGGAGVTVGINSSTIGISYQLFNGTASVGGLAAGTGSSLSLGLLATPGTYTVVAAASATTCSADMSGSATINVNPLPGLHTVTGGGSYCAGGTGVDVGLSNSSFGVNYQLYLGSSTVGIPMTGTGTSLDFGYQIPAGAYTIIASDATTSCSRTMTGTANITINPAPPAHTITGGGNYCPGGTGVDIGLDGSDPGFTYQLYNGTTAIGAAMPGTSSALDFGMQTGTGAYTVVANSTTSCSGTMTGTAFVSLSSLPAVYNVSGGGSYCPAGTGIHIGLTGSSLGVNYQLYNAGVMTGTAVPGTGLPIDFGLETATGTYSVVGTSSATTCSSNMSGMPLIAISPLPAVHSVTGGGNYCVGGAGVHVGLDGSDAGITYQLYNSTSPVGSIMVGTGSLIDFGSQTGAGTYTVVATNASTTCTNTMAGSQTITINSLPSVYSVTGGGVYCAGTAGSDIALTGSDAGISYQLYNGSATVGSALTGSGSSIDFGPKTAAGLYTVIASNTTTTCSNAMAGGATISINPAPYAYSVSGGGNYCAGSAGVHVILSGSGTGVSYQLYAAGVSTGSPVTGSGFPLDFGLQTATGSYTVVATNTTTSCTNNMSGSVPVIMDPLPALFALSGAGTNYCAGGAGIDLLLSGSEPGVRYQLYDGGAATGIPVTGTGSPVNFGYQTAAGSYSVVALNTTTTCSDNMVGGASISVNPLPLVYMVTGGGNYCTGGAGANISLAGSSTGVKYQLYNSGSLIGSPVSGSGSAVSFGLQTATGSYTVVAANSTTGCVNNMSGSATITIDPLPASYTVTGGGNYCSGGSGVHVGLYGSATGVNYELYKDAASTGTVMIGTSFPLDFGLEATAGTYTVVAINTTTTCTGNMAGSATVSVDPLPAVYPLTGGGNFCAGGTGVHIGLSGSNSSVSYRLYNGGTATGSAISGGGTGIDFGLQAAPGTYTVIGTNSATGCVNNMSGSETVVVNPLPTVYSVVGGGSYCVGGAGLHVGLSNSNSGVSYQLYNGFSSAGSPIVSAGGPLDLGIQTAAGTYTVIATGAGSCTTAMADSAVITIATMEAPAVSISTGAGVGDTVCYGSMITFNATPINGGSTPAYQWTVNGVSTATSNPYTYLPADGDIVGVVLTSSSACASPTTASSMVIMSVLTNEVPSVTVAASPGTNVCQGTTVTYSSTIAYGGSAPTYTWYRNGGPASTSPSFSVIPNNGDDIYCAITSNYHCRVVTDASSNHLVMQVDTPGTPVVTISANPGLNIAYGTSLTLYANIANAGHSPSIQWYLNGVAVPGATGPAYNSDNFNNLDEVTCQVTTNDACAATQGSASATIHIDNVGVQQVSSLSGDIQLIPNPNKGIFTIKGTLGVTNDEEVSYEITNMLGQVIYSNKVMVHGGNLNEKIELNNTPANGMYLLNLRSGSESRVFHMVIEQ